LCVCVCVCVLDSECVAKYKYRIRKMLTPETSNRQYTRLSHNIWNVRWNFACS